MCLEDEWKDMKKSSRVLEDIGPFRAAALNCITKINKFTVHRYIMNTCVRVYMPYDWSGVTKLSECENWSKKWSSSSSHRINMGFSSFSKSEEQRAHTIQL